MNTQEEMSQDLSRLAERIREGEAAAEEEFICRFQRGLTLALRRRCQDPSLAEDLTQDTLLLVLEKIRSNEVRDTARLAGFIHGTAKNLLLAHRRKNSRLVALETAPTAVTEASSGTDGNSNALPLHQLLRKEEAQLVRQLLDELTVKRDRQLLIRFYLSHQPRSVICSDLAIEEEHFRRVLFRARERLKELWQRFKKREQLLGGVS